MGGGVGAHICGLKPGDDLAVKVKPPRVVHGKPQVVNRWTELGLIGGGTGVAPFVQMASMLLAHTGDETRISLVRYGSRF